jgi:hypothetical protein
VIVTLALTGCRDDGRKSGAEGVADAYEQLADFECSCVAEQFGDPALEQQCREELSEIETEDFFPFECIDRAVSGNAQAEAVFDCAVDATYDYVDCLVAEGCEGPPEEFTCADGSGTYTDFDKCDGFDDCADASDEADGCMTEPFVCADGQELSPWSMCDGYDDCEDGADEAGCPETCDSVFSDASQRCGDVPESVGAKIEECFPSYECADGSSAPEGSGCDGFDDCADGSDEAGCTGPEIAPTVRRALRRAP